MYAITREDVKLIQGIGERKSINDLTKDELKILESVAEKYYREMGVKSPFFRRWFGDWRAQDKTPVKFFDIKKNKLNKSKRYIHNNDVESSILIDDTIFNDSMSYAYKNKDEKPTLSLLSNIDTLLENAVLLDTETSQKNKGS